MRNLELELQAAQSELESLTESASPSRLERAPSSSRCRSCSTRTSRLKKSRQEEINDHS